MPSTQGGVGGVAWELAVCWESWVRLLRVIEDSTGVCLQMAKNVSLPMPNSQRDLQQREPHVKP